MSFEEFYSVQFLMYPCIQVNWSELASTTPMYPFYISNFFGFFGPNSCNQFLNVHILVNALAQKRYRHIS